MDGVKNDKNMNAQIKVINTHIRNITYYILYIRVDKLYDYHKIDFVL